MSQSTPASFNELIHSPVRLRICGMLSGVDRLEFQAIREALDIAEAHLSKNLKVLADVGYVQTTKEISSLRKDARRLTWVSLSPKGREAFTGHVRRLQQIAAGEI